MNGVHDLGGMHGFGPIEIEPDEPNVHASWEPRVVVLHQRTNWEGLFNLDAFRYGIERMDPAAYLTTPYFGRWLETVTYNLIHHGWISEEELEARIAHFREHPDVPPPPAAPIARPPSHHPPEAQPAPSPPRFSVGDAVVAHNVHPVGHTRLPRYVRGKRGVVNLVHAPELLPDVNAHGPGAPLEVVYNVRFEASELWGSSAEPHQTVNIDLWDSYLDPVGQ